MNKTKLLSLVAAVAFIAGVSMSVTKVHAYGMAGCGLGSMVIKSNDMLQIFAATTNGTSGNQTFGITTGTSGCTSSSAKLEEQKQEIFVTVNYENLEQEMAAGSGEKVDALAKLLGCSSEEFAAMSQANYKEYFSEDATPSSVLQKVRASASSCSI